MSLSVSAPVRFQGISITVRDNHKVGISVLPESSTTIGPDMVTIEDWRGGFYSSSLIKPRFLAHADAAGELTAMLDSPEVPDPARVRSLLNLALDQVFDQFKEGLYLNSPKQSHAVSLLREYGKILRDTISRGQMIHEAVVMVRDQQNRLYKGTFVNGKTG